MKNAQGARERLGEALHTIQDFYSHSNWMELGNTGPNPGLGRPSGVLSRLADNVATCVNCTPCLNCASNVITTQLTSGYYASQGVFGVTLEDRVKPNANKCSHGGPLDASTNGVNGGINKDSSVCSISPHSERHGAAASAAKDATKQFLRDIKALVTPSQLKLLLGVGPTLTIAMDTTGSMGSIIESVKQQAIQIVNARLGTDEEPSKYVLAPFNDPGVGPGSHPGAATAPSCRRAAPSKGMATALWEIRSMGWATYIVRLERLHRIADTTLLIFSVGLAVDRFR